MKRKFVINSVIALLVLISVFLGFFILKKQYGFMLSRGQNNYFMQSAIFISIYVIYILFTNNKLKKLQQFMIWIAITLSLLLLYSYKNQVIGMKNRILAELIPSEAQVKDGYVAIKRSNDGHFYAQVNINDLPVLFMVDTGASDITISTAEAGRLGIDITNLNFNRQYSTANGVIHAADYKVDSISLGNITINNMYISINPSPMGVGLLGMSFFDKMKEFKVAGDVMYIMQ